MKNTKKLAGAIAALAVSAALATGTTYAWFASNGTATVESFDAQVTTMSNSLDVIAMPTGDTTSLTANTLAWDNYVSADEVWNAIISSTYTTSDSDKTKSKIALDALTTAQYVNTAGASTVAKQYSNKKTTDESGATAGASSADATNFKLYRNSTNVVDEALQTCNDFSHNDDGTVSGSYIQFDLAFRSASQVAIMLTNDSKVGTPENANSKDVKAWEAITASEYGNEAAIEKNASLGANAANAVRVAFTNVKSDASNGTAGALAGTAQGNKYWAPNEYYITGAASGDAGTTGDGVTEPTVNTNNYKGYYKGNLGGNYNAYKHVWTNYVNKQVAFPSNCSLLACASSTLDVVDSARIGTCTPVSTSADYTYLRFTVTIWIEGTDGDCFDDILKDSISVSLSFKAVEKSST